MKKVIYNRFDKKKLTNLPVELFTGKIVIVQSEDEAQKAVDYLLSQSVLGVDTETRPCFKKGHFHHVALLQVATHDICFLFRLSQIGMTPSVIRLLEDKNVPKIGLSWSDDNMNLQKREEFIPGNFIDIQKIVALIGVEDQSLQKLYANLFGKKISKRQRLTNWEASVLNDKQRLYAATDAWACIKLYEEIIRLNETKDYELVVVPETNNDENQTNAN